MDCDVPDPALIVAVSRAVMAARPYLYAAWHVVGIASLFRKLEILFFLL
jgi:hypothetical protein